MADSPSDPSSDDPLGSFADQAELLEFLEETVRRLGHRTGPTGPTGAIDATTDAPGWRVDARDDGTYAVVSEGTDEVAGTFRERGRAYLVAATLTAAGSQALQPEEPPAADAVAEPAGGLFDERGEAWERDPMERRKELTARTLRGLLANPKALELFLESIDPEILREAMEIREAEREDGADEAN